MGAWLHFINNIKLATIKRITDTTFPKERHRLSYYALRLQPILLFKKQSPGSIECQWI